MIRSRGHRAFLGPVEGPDQQAGEHQPTGYLADVSDRVGDIEG